MGRAINLTMTRGNRHTFLYLTPEPRYIWGAGCSQSIDMDMGVASEHVWPHMLAPQAWSGLPEDPGPMVGKASGPLTRLME